MRFWQKVIGGAATLVVLILLVACRPSSRQQPTASLNGKNLAGAVTLWVDAVQVPAYQQLVATFTKKYPHVVVTVTPSPNGTVNAKTDVPKTTPNAADVFEVPNDQLGQLAEAGYINPLSPAAAKKIKATNIEAAYDAMKWQGKLYGYPWAQQANVLYYNKARLSADDVKSWDTLTAKGVIGLDFTVPYDTFPIFVTAGVQLFGEDGETLAGATMASQAGQNALAWFAQQQHNRGVIETSTEMSLLKTGQLGAIIGGPWDAQAVRKILGDDLAVTTLPTITLAGKSVPMKAFLGVMAFAVNAHTAPAKQQAAQTLAAYLTDRIGQLALYQAQGQIPIDKQVLQTSALTTDSIAVAVVARARRSVLMPKMPQMAQLWDNAPALMIGAYTGTIKPADYSAKLAAFQEVISQP
ncbi:extracellular solute-binding protein [Lacticaseibacillus mingshuiensis]|uniref:Extracellular solute-binding protein n=1 Tax=Lacticaseibacillus mingshuiensis TaxID=2799574 RepID=A0ABW4CL73_9LACO|nr:extracellular solute-binding protein [Lacticaseibacillus mingshuiensis]